MKIRLFQTRFELNCDEIETRNVDSCFKRQDNTYLWIQTFLKYKHTMTGRQNIVLERLIGIEEFFKLETYEDAVNGPFVSSLASLHSSGISQLVLQIRVQPTKIS